MSVALAEIAGFLPGTEVLQHLLGVHALQCGMHSPPLDEVLHIIDCKR